MRTRELLLVVTFWIVPGLVVASCSPMATPVPAVKPTSGPTEERVAGTPVPPSLFPGVSTPTPKSGADQPRYGGTLTVSLHEELPSLDMHQETAGVVAHALMPAYGGLIRTNPQNQEEIIGDLAKNWEIGRDGLTYTFNLHENVRFHDASPLTAEDIRYSLERQINPPRGVRAMRGGELAVVDKMETPEKYVLKVTLKYPCSPVLSGLAEGRMVVYSKDFVEKRGHMKNDVMGTGPFKFRAYAMGTSLELLKNPSYFVQGRPYLDAITFYIIKDSATRLAALRTGRVKLSGLQTLKPNQAETLRKSDSGLIVKPYDGFRHAVFIANIEQKPWTDVRVRKAVHLALDREAAIKALAHGYGDIGSNFPGQWAIPRDELSKMPGWRQPKDDDVAEARRLMAEAGYATGIKVKALAMASEDYLNFAVYTADQLRKIGIEMELDVRETAVRGTMIAQGTFNNHPFSSSALYYPDPYNAFRYFAPPQDGDFRFNYQRFVDDKILELFEKQSRTLDVTERKRIVGELDRRIIETAVRPLAFWWKDAFAISPEIRDYAPPFGLYSSVQKFERVWLAK